MRAPAAKRLFASTLILLCVLAFFVSAFTRSSAYGVPSERTGVAASAVAPAAETGPVASVRFVGLNYNRQHEFEILLTGDPGATAKVFYRTRNGSAIGNINFAPQDQSANMRVGEKLKVYVQIRNAQTYGLVTEAGMSRYALQYALEIYRVDGGRVADAPNNEAEADIGGCAYPVIFDGNVISATSAAKQKYMTKIQWSSSTEASYGGTNVFSRSDFTKGVSPEIEGDMIASGFTQAPSDYSVQYLLNHGAQTYVNIGSSWKAGIRGAIKPVDIKIKSVAEATNQTIRESETVYNGEASYKSIKDNESGSFDLFGSSVFTKSSGNVTPLQGKSFVSLGASGNASRAFTVLYQHKGVYFVKCDSMSAQFLYYDSKAPQITGYYVQNSVYRGGDKITLSVKFDEFVRVDPKIAQTPAIRVSDGTSGGAFLLNYGGGSGTDTLWFTGTVPLESGTGGFDGKPISLSKLEVMSFRDFGAICDYSFGALEQEHANYYDIHSAVNQGALEQDSPDSVKMEVTVDTRQPALSISRLVNVKADNSTTTIDSLNNNTLLRVARVTITAKNVSENAVLQYFWTKKQDISEILYWSTATLKTIDKYPEATIESPNTINGIGYLHYRYQAPNGNVAVGKQAYNFDNTGPISEISVASKDNPNQYGKTHLIQILSRDESPGDEVTGSGISYVGYAISTEPNATIGANEFLQIENNGEPIKVNGPAGKIGKYYVYVRALDKNLVETVTRSEFMLLFDARELTEDDIAVGFSGEAGRDDWAQLVDNAYYKYANLKLTYSEGVDWEFALVTKNGAPYEKPELTKATDSTGTSVERTATFSEVGYYEIAFRTTVAESVSPVQSRTYSFYVFGDDDGGLNYDALHKSEAGLGNYPITKYWVMLENKYYRLTDSGMSMFYFCEDAERKLVFSSQSAARAYVIGIEQKDIAEIVLTENLAKALNSGQGYVNPDKSLAVEGATWYRYKAYNWDPMQGANQYYYFAKPLSDQSGKLYESFQNNVNRMVGTIEAGSYQSAYQYAQYKDVMNFESGKAAFNFSQIKYDPNMLADTVRFMGADYRITGSYTFQDAEQTRLFYRRHTETESVTSYYALPTGVARDVLSPSGVYDIREIGYRGVKEYTIYVDGEAPVLTVSLTDGMGSILPLDSISKSMKIDTLNLKSMTFSAIRSDEIDPWSILSIVSRNTVTYTATMAELTAQNGYRLDREGSYTVYVYDRTGNGFSFSVVIVGNPLNVTLETRASAFHFTMNRKPNEIQSLSVRFNGQIVTSDFDNNSLVYPTTSEFVFAYSGVYEFEITDIYGYTFSKSDFNCFKAVPEGNFTRYNADTGRYDTVTDTETVKKIDDFSYLIYINTPIRFQYYSSALTVEWIGNQPPNSELIPPTSGIGTQVWRLSIPDSSIGWSFRLVYEKDPYVFVTYTCINDTTPPLIEATGEKDGVSFSTENGAVVSADRVVVVWSDPETGVASVTYRYGNRDMRPALGATSLTITEEGSYTVTVKNILGLETVLTFTLDNNVSADVVLDGRKLESGSNYGHGDVYIKLFENVQIEVVGNGDGRSAYLVFRDNLLKVNGIPPENAPDTWEDASVECKFIDIEPGKAVFLEDLANFYNIYYGRDENGTPYAALYAPGESDTNSVYAFSVRIRDFYGNESEEVGIETSRISSSPDFYYAADGKEFSGEAINVDIKMDQYPKDADTTEIFYRYSEDGEKYGDPIAVFDHGTLTPVLFSVNGYYEVTVENKFGNFSVTLLRLLREVSLSVSAVYHDGETVAVNNKEIYSNNLVRFTATFDVLYQVISTKDGVPAFLGFSLNSDTSRYEMTVLGVGFYTLEISDNFGNLANYKVTITAPATVERKEFLTGFNDKALKKDEHYTNRPLLFDQNTLGDIWYIRYEYRDERRVVYDRLGVRPINELSTRIGSDGDGVYRVVFMGRSGDKVKFGSETYLEIHYCSEGGFRLSRQTRSEEEYGDYALSEALRYGFWSNYKLRFEVTAQQYRFTVNGVESGDTEIVMTAEMTNAAYEIYFLDEYGNEYAFNAYLDKRDPAVSFLDPSKLVDLNGVWYCGTEVVLVCATDGVQAEYRKDNVAPVPYRAGDPISGDGSYEVTFTDRAGNKTRFYFNIDSVVDAKLIRSGDASSVALIDREVVNEGTVRVSRTGAEDVSVVKVMQDGVDKTEAYAGQTSWSEAGEYVVSVGDPVGNVREFRFYIVKGAVSSFVYKSPEGWTITDVSVETGGLKHSVPEYVKRDESGVTYVELSGNFLFEVTLTDRKDILHTLKFTVTTDVSAPTAEIENLTEKTKNDIIIHSVSEDSTITIYRDGALYKTLSAKAGEKIDEAITEKGFYRISIIDGAGNETIYEAERLYTMNGFALAVVIVVGIVLVIAVLLFFLARKRMKVR